MNNVNRKYWLALILKLGRDHLYADHVTMRNTYYRRTQRAIGIVLLTLAGLVVYIYWFLG